MVGIELTSSVGGAAVIKPEGRGLEMQASSIEGRFDRQKSIRSKTRVSSIEDCNYCLSVLNLLFMKSAEKYFLIQLTHVFKEHDRQP